jgi:hypothetical protein
LKDNKWLALLLAGVIVALAIIFTVYRFTNRPIISTELLQQKSTINHSVVVEKVQSVAKLVSSESTLRDVVTYENTWLGSTKRSLVVVTGKVLAGINLEQGSDIQIDEQTRRITITLPRASVIAIDVNDIKTYNEEGGLWNPFQPADRDNIFRLARTQFEKAAQEMKLTDHAEQSAKQVLETLFSTSGYQTEVKFSQPPLLRK